MAVSRRSFLRISLGIGLLASSGYILKDLYFPSPLTAGEIGTLEAFLDTLIPADSTPGALELGVAGKILVTAREDAGYRRLIRKGCGWLDGKARGRKADSFFSLDGQGREILVAEAAEHAQGSLPRIFFERMRNDAFSHFYAHPASWKGLRYKGPPQPDGYPDYALGPPAQS